MLMKFLSEHRQVVEGRLEGGKVAGLEGREMFFLLPRADPPRRS